VAGVIGVGVALAVAALWFARQRPEVARSALESTVTATVTRHDSFGMPEKPLTLRDRARVRALVAALGVDGQPPVRCPPDYASAELGILLGGADVYARRNVYVWGLRGDGGDGGDTRVVVVTSSGCRGGPPADAPSLRRELARL
jgi:hypothetical protein